MFEFLGHVAFFLFAQRAQVAADFPEQRFDPRLVFQAIAFDPLSAAVLSLAEIRSMVNEMFNRYRDYLPQFKV